MLRSQRHISKWLLWSILGMVLVSGVGAGAYLLGKSSDDDGSTAAASGSAYSPQGASDDGPAGPCSKPTAKDAVIDSEFEGAVRELGVVPAGEPLFGGSGYVVVEVICRDLTADGPVEMVTELDCCAGGAPTPWAIFVADERGWQLAFYRSGIQATLSVRSGAVVERSPAYAPGEPTCCPSSFRLGRIRWDGNVFAFETNEASANRTIKAGRRGVTRLGGFDPQNKSPADAAREFGPPSYVGPNGELCVNEWHDLGLRISFANLGGPDPCSAEGRVGSIELKDELAAQAGWETETGVRVGMSAEELRETYPDAKPQLLHGLGRVLVLIERPALIGVVGTSPVLSARIADGAVDELRMSVAAPGSSYRG
ncbi:MAG TPA: hypothetical protein VHJ54_06695 [Solirubrobacterales bacterium]|jgi:hypothetical protein|nr:hypothetical protein [Solirubrobacterales bacterium]